MAAFVTFPTGSPAGNWGATFINGVNERVKSRVKSYDSTTGVITLENTSILNTDLSNGVTIYFFGGDYQDRKPWYFSPNTDTASLYRIQSYYLFSEWVLLNGWDKGANVFGPRDYIANQGGMDPGNDGGGPGPEFGVPDFINPDDLDNINFSIL